MVKTSKSTKPNFPNDTFKPSSSSSFLANNILLQQHQNQIFNHQQLLTGMHGNYKRINFSKNNQHTDASGQADRLSRARLNIMAQYQSDLFKLFPPLRNNSGLVQGMQALGITDNNNNLNMSSQLGTNGNLTFSQQQQISQKLLQESRLASNPAELIRKLRLSNSLYEGLALNGQQPMLQNSVSQQQEEKMIIDRLDAILKMTFLSNKRKRSKTAWENEIAEKEGRPKFVYKDPKDGKGDDEIGKIEEKLMVDIYGRGFDQEENEEVNNYDHKSETTLGDNQGGDDNAGMEVAGDDGNDDASN